jgi:hypothetical protein
MFPSIHSIQKPKQLSFTKGLFQMDLYRLASLGNCHFTPQLVIPSKSTPLSFMTSRSGIVPRTFMCMATSEISSPSNIVRRSANYQPPIWHYDYIQSLTSAYVVYIYITLFLFIFSLNYECIYYLLPS